MRISDWSSDVCSSDLRCAPLWSEKSVSLSPAGMIFDMDILGAREASPKFQSVLYRRRLERVNPFWVYEFGVLCQTPGFRPRDLMILMPGLRRDQPERGLRVVRVSEAEGRRNVGG